MLVLPRLPLLASLAVVMTGPGPAPAQTAIYRAAAAAVLPGYLVRQASAFGARCDGAKDDTLALQNALNALSYRQALQLPAGTCLISHQLRLAGKSNVAVVGAGKERTILQATDPLHSSFIVRLSSNVRIEGFQVYSPNTTGMKRTSDANSKGFMIGKSVGVVLDGVGVRQVAGAGIFLTETRDSKVLNSEVVKSLADAFHITGGSENIVVKGNLAEGAGDDGFASIGYGEDINRNIQFFDNVARDGSWGGGVSFEGTNGGKAYRNRIYRSGVAAIRIASQKLWDTGPSDNLDLQDNYLEGCVTRKITGHGSVLIYTDFKDVGPHITLLRTVIKDPASGPGVKAFGKRNGKATVSASVNDSVMSGVFRAFLIEPGATISESDNKVFPRSRRLK